MITDLPRARRLVGTGGVEAGSGVAQLRVQRTLQSHRRRIATDSVADQVLSVTGIENALSFKQEQNRVVL